MAANDYQYTEVAGSSFTRCSRVVVENPKEGGRSISFSEEQLINLPGRVIATPLGNLAYPIAADMDEEFDLLDPDTGEVTGTTTFAQAYAVVHSAYMHVAKKRDSKAAE